MIKIIGIILSLIFSGITTYSFIASNKCLTSVLIVEGIGQATIILSVIMSIMHFDKAFILFMCIGLILIIVSCIINGLNMYGHVHLSHHIVRIALSVIIVVLCGLGMRK